MSESIDWIVPPNAARTIVSVGLGSHYRKLLRSTANHCAVWCPEARRLFVDALPTLWPSHGERRYGFKIHALREPVNAGYHLILWMDATLAPIGPINGIWGRILRDGYFALASGSRLGTHTSDAALEIYGITRDEAMEIPHVLSGLVGINMAHPTGREVWAAWERLYERGAFEGPHFNSAREGLPFYTERPVGNKWAGLCSNDPRCEGHRHDESALSFVLHSLGLPASGGMPWEQYNIGSHVPDFDVVAMRKWIMDHGGPAELCR